MSWAEIRPLGDPTPGDPDGVQALAQMAGEAAGEFQRAQTFVAGIADGSEIRGVWTGLAADAFMVRAKDFDPELARAEESFTRLSAALFTWRSQLSDLQERAATCLSAARTAQRERSDAERDLWWAEAEYDRADPPFDTSREDFLRPYRDTCEYWDGCLNAQLEVADGLATEHAEKAGRVAQAVVDASKAGFRGDNLWEKTQTYAGYVGEEIGEYLEDLDEFLDHFMPAIALLGFLPGAQPLVIALALIQLTVTLGRVGYGHDIPPWKVALDLVSVVAPASKYVSTKHARIVDKAMNYARGRPYSQAIHAFTGKHLSTTVYLNQIHRPLNLIDHGHDAIQLYERYGDPLVTNLGERSVSTPPVHVRPCTVQPLTPFTFTPSVNLFLEDAYVR